MKLKWYHKLDAWLTTLQLILMYGLDEALVKAEEEVRDLEFILSRKGGDKQG